MDHANSLDAYLILSHITQMLHFGIYFFSHFIFILEITDETEVTVSFIPHTGTLQSSRRRW